MMPSEWVVRLQQEQRERAMINAPEATHLLVSPATDLSIRGSLTHDERFDMRPADPADDYAAWIWRGLRIVADRSVADGEIILMDATEYAIWWRNHVAEAVRKMGEQNPELRTGPQRPNLDGSDVRTGPQDA